ncbi:MAG: AAA-like domain-containing protein [Nostoc sp. LLA-1]|nr:AAA-like domain-containing protein [Cyanocohniella sp. LLY]
MSWDLVKACTVAIATPEDIIRGTGFFISSTGHLLTCAHVVEDADGWENVRINGQKVELVYLGNSSHDDFAVLQLPGYQGEAAPLLLTFEPGKQFRSIGYGRLDFPQGGTIEGSITDANPHADFNNLCMLRLRVMADSQQIIGGYSGSPVFDTEAQAVVGIIAAYDNTQGGLAVPLQTVQKNWWDLADLLHSELASKQELLFFDSAFYAGCYREIERPGSLIRVKAPLQWGKTYLMIQIFNHATQQGYQAVRVDFQEPEQEVFNSLERFLQWFCSSIAKGLHLSDNLAQHWGGILSANSNCTNYLERLLAVIPSPLVLGLDNTDVIFSYPAIACNFLPLLRAWYEKGRTQPLWQKLRLVIAYAQEEYIPIDRNRSPFNVGKPVEIPELTQEQIQKFVQYLKLYWHEEQIIQLMAMVGGHPWLVKKALHKIAQRELTLEKFLDIAPTEEGLYGDHLLRYWSTLQDNPELLAAMQQVVSANVPVRIDPDKAYKLRSMRLVKYTGNSVQPLCDLYRLYFRDRLGLW